jgi:hypothetical protein
MFYIKVVVLDEVWNFVVESFSFKIVYELKYWLQDLYILVQIDIIVELDTSDCGVRW